MNPDADALTALRSWHAAGDGQALDQGQAHGQAVFPGDLAVFTGHFPDRPLVPGVHQVALFVLLLQRVLRPGLQLVAITRGKWTAPVLPDTVLDLRVRWRTADATLVADCECLAGDQPTASCRLVLTG